MEETGGIWRLEGIGRRLEGIGRRLEGIWRRLAGYGGDWRG